MGIKDEIAFLSCTSKSLGTYSDAIDDVLSILDEHLGECVLEDTVRSHGYLNDVVRDLMKLKENDWFVQAYKGNCISIYVRRKNESSS